MKALTPAPTHEFIVYHMPHDRAAYMCPFGQQPTSVHIVTVGSEAHCLRHMLLAAPRATVPESRVIQ
jgi:hypothetical protein